MYTNANKIEELENFDTDDEVCFDLKLNCKNELKNKEAQKLNKKRERDNTEKIEKNDINICDNDFIFLGCEDGHIKIIEIKKESITRKLLGY